MLFCNNYKIVDSNIADLDQILYGKQSRFKQSKLSVTFSPCVTQFIIFMNQMCILPANRKKSSTHSQQKVNLELRALP